MNLRVLFSIFIIFHLAKEVKAQSSGADTNLVQLSGLVLDGAGEALLPVAYTNVFIKGRSSGTFADIKGFFSIVARKGDVVRFTSVGYKTIEYPVPKSLVSDRYSIVQLMTRDTINLPETIIFPWPSRENFTADFLAMDVSHAIQEKAQQNLARESLEKLRFEVPKDGREYTGYYQHQYTQKYYSMGQTPPMNIFNPLAWAQFFKEWKQGKYKKKKK